MSWLVRSRELDSYATGTNVSATSKINMEKPSARGPSPGRKASHALGARLNRKPKRPPLLPLKKKASDTERTVNR